MQLRPVQKHTWHTGGSNDSGQCMQEGKRCGREKGGRGYSNMFQFHSAAAAVTAAFAGGWRHAAPAWLHLIA